MLVTTPQKIYGGFINEIKFSLIFVSFIKEKVITKKKRCLNVTQHWSFLERGSIREAFGIPKAVRKLVDVKLDVQ